MSVPFWDDNPDAWNTLYLGGRAVPGLCTVTGRAGRKIEPRSAPGADGASIRDQGYEPAPIEVEIRVWTSAQLEELEELLERVHPRQRGRERTPFDVVHPVLSMLGIRSAYVTAVTLPELRGGVTSVRVSLLEWTQAPRRSRQAQRSTGGGLEGIQTALDIHRAQAAPQATPPARLAGAVPP
jgi:hypothetical protein